MRATVRWVRADLRVHRGEALFLVLATAGIIASLLLAGAFLTYAANPWQRVFTQSSGAHVWIHTKASADAGTLAGLDGVRAASGPFPTAGVTAELGGDRAAVRLRAAGARPPAVGRPLPVSGRWLGPGTPDGVVLESSVARALWAEPGDALRVRGPDGTVRRLRVVGVADSAEPRYAPGENPGTGWVLPAALERLAPEEDRRGLAVGLRLDDPEDTDFAVQQAVTALGADQIAEVSTWKQARAEAVGGDRLLGLLLGAFGIGALLARPWRSRARSAPGSTAICGTSPSSKPSVSPPRSSSGCSWPSISPWHWPGWPPEPSSRSCSARTCPAGPGRRCGCGGNFPSTPGSPW